MGQGNPSRTCLYYKTSKPHSPRPAGRVFSWLDGGSEQVKVVVVVQVVVEVRLVWVSGSPHQHTARPGGYVHLMLVDWMSQWCF